MALTGARLYPMNKQPKTLTENYNIPNGASGFYLLGVVLEKQGKVKQAVECYEKALLMQPTLWCAFEKLCKLAGGPNSDERVDAAKIFTATNLDIQQMNSMIKEHMHIQQYT